MHEYIKTERNNLFYDKMCISALHETLRYTTPCTNGGHPPVEISFNLIFKLTPNVPFSHPPNAIIKQVFIINKE